MQITLDVFSGRSNPTWALADADARQLVERTAGYAFAAVTAGPGTLGFRGFVIETASDDEADRAGLPAAFRVAAGAPVDAVLSAPGLAARALSPRNEVDIALWLLSTLTEKLEDDVLAHVKARIEAGASGTKPDADTFSESGPSPDHGDAAPKGIAKAPCLIQNTAYNPGFWNVPSVQPYNNCYNYAMNWRSNTFAQPGRISGHPNNVMQCANVSTAANWDGCTAVCSGSNKNVALVVWPGADYHWYRLHSNGFWGHKPGSTAARNTDNSGRVIGGALNPYNCNRGPYTLFCGYRFSPTGMQVR